MAASHDNAVRFFAKRLEHEAAQLLMRVQPRDRDVEPALKNVRDQLLAEPEFNADTHARMKRDQSLDRDRHEVGRRRHRGADSHLTGDARRERRDFLVRLPELGERRARVAHERLSERRRNDTARVTLEEGDT